MSVRSSFTHKPFLSALFCWAIGCSGSQSPDLDKFAQRFEPTFDEVQTIAEFLAGEGGNAYRAMRDKHSRAKQKGNILLTPDVGHGDVLPLVSGVVPRSDPIPGAKELLDLLMPEEADQLRYGLLISYRLVAYDKAFANNSICGWIQGVSEIFKKYQDLLPLFGIDLNSNEPIVYDNKEIINQKAKQFLEKLSIEEEEEEELEVGSEAETDDRPPSDLATLIDEVQSLYDDDLFSNDCTLGEAFRIADLFAPYIEEEYYSEQCINDEQYLKRNLKRLRFIQGALSGEDLTEFDKFCLLKAAKWTVNWSKGYDHDWLGKIANEFCLINVDNALSGLVTKFVAALSEYLKDPDFSTKQISFAPPSRNILDFFRATLPNSGINNFVHSERILIWYLSRDNRPLPPRLFSLLDMCEYCDPAVVEYASTKSQVKVYSAQRYGRAPDGTAGIVQKARIALEAIANAE